MNKIYGNDKYIVIKNTFEQCIKLNKEDYSLPKVTIKELCKIANVSRSGYYHWLKRYNGLDKDFNDYTLIKNVFESKHKKAGWRVIKMALETDNIIMNHKKIKRIMKKYKLMTKVRRRNPYKNIATATKEHRVMKNILKRNFTQSKPLKVLLTDITYLHYSNGNIAYLGAVKDVATREILSYHISQNLSMDLGLRPIKDISDKYSKNDLEGCIIHSDQGIHYTYPEFICACKKANLIQSMSRKGNCLDNAPMESFFGHLKDEVDYRMCRTFDEVKNLVSNYIEYYNNKRKQWGLKKMTPVHYKNHLMVS
ncbi:IS3 family transposase [Clostridioides sp. ZZV14-6345]|nr:IS3 family transposase [Clostridioides sp. ZZV14-6345]